MPFHVWSKIRTELLMDVSASLADYTHTPEDFRHIPAYLARTFDLHPVTLAIVHTVWDGALVFLSAFSGDQAPAVLEQDVLNIHQQTRPLSAQDGPTLRPMTEIGPSADIGGGSAGSLGGLGRATVFTHSIDEAYRMLLIVHRCAGDPHLSADLTDILQLVAQQLGKFLEPLVIWMARPELFGKPFSGLTDREWMVLRHLNSDAGEKQLADQLGFSPHTLHSHIKSIYRKVGVQGRLPLILKAQRAMRELRLSRVSTRSSPPVAELDRAVGVG